jgi:hypothetical protein
VIQLRNEEAIDDQALRRIQRDIDLPKPGFSTHPKIAVTRLRWRGDDAGSMLAVVRAFPDKRTTMPSRCFHAVSNHAAITGSC